MGVVKRRLDSGITKTSLLGLFTRTVATLRVANSILLGAEKLATPFSNSGTQR
ncbi:hypothetical protein BDZ89DRAFT_1074142 [Hymenopellis radicata]|nr:hypothetical protein BDZ89DRAFT_1079771 [Hymenopellis radicata]KAF9018202.1 hypothetical protein BDZ89DRAFT_1074142 [Hymenopellis radicata]